MRVCENMSLVEVHLMKRFRRSSLLPKILRKGAYFSSENNVHNSLLTIAPNTSLLSICRKSPGTEYERSEVKEIWLGLAPFIKLALI